jgi:tetratricopeptide (TPR) repeat protein
MLLASTNSHKQYGNEETLILQLLIQQRYAEAYLLLNNEPPNDPATQYNLALCYYWAKQYQEAIICLDKVQTALPYQSSNVKLPNAQFYTVIVEQQNQRSDHLQGVSKRYISIFAVLMRDAIIRFKTDCWLQLGEYSKVIETAAPIAHKNYRNITEALQIANNRTNL